MGENQREKESTVARVVVVGGGYGGVTVAKGLDQLAEVIMVEQKDQ